jgi:hypothetical protein
MIASAKWGAKDVKTMSTSTAAPHITEMLWAHKLVGLIRSQLTAFAALCLAAAVVPQAIAQCGPNITLPAEQWSMVGYPCEPGTNDTIGTAFGPNLTAATYNSTWIAWNRVYEDLDPDPDVVVPNDYYTKLTVADIVSAGDAVWIYTTVEAELDFSMIGATRTLGPFFEFTAVVAESNTSPRYYMFANPYDDKVNWEDLTFASGGGGRSFKTKTAVNLSIVGANIHYWNGNTYYERSLDSFPVATFEPKEAAWLEMLEGVPPLVEDLQIQVPAP